MKLHEIVLALTFLAVAAFLTLWLLLDVQASGAVGIVVLAGMIYLALEQIAVVASGRRR